MKYQQMKYTMNFQARQTVAANLSGGCFSFYETGRILIKQLFLYTVKITTITLLKMTCSEAATRRGIKVLAETGGAVSALTSEEHAMNTNKVSQLQAAERYVG